MLSRIFSWIANYLAKLVDGWAVNREVETDKTDIAAKSAEAKAELARLNELNQLKTTAATEAADLTVKVQADEAAVVNADVEMKSATEKIKNIKISHGVTQDELEAKLKQFP